MSNQTQAGARTLTDDELLSAVPPTAGAREFRVGVFVILGIVGFFTVLFLMTSPAMFRGRYMVQTEIDNAQGIRRGDPVRMRGINIGRVHAFDLAPAGGVLITLEVEGEYRIPAPARAELLSEGFLGGMVVAVIPGRGNSGEIEPWDVIPGEVIGGVLDTAGDIALDASDVLGRVQALLSDSTTARTGAAVASLRDMLEDLAEAADGQAGAIRALTESLQRSAENVEGITGAEDWNRALESAEGTMDNLRSATATLEESAASLDVILNRLEGGEGTLGRLLTTDDLHESLDSTLKSLRDLLEDVRENPGRYIKIEIF